MKRHEIIVKHWKSQELLAESNLEAVEELVVKHHARGVLSREEFAELLAYRDQFESEYLELQGSACMAKHTLRRAHVAYCRARTSTTNRIDFLTYRESLERAAEPFKVPKDIRSLSPELSANSLRSHAPPIETASKTETLSS
jgi:hypothetical protein